MAIYNKDDVIAALEEVLLSLEETTFTIIEDIKRLGLDLDIEDSCNEELTLDWMLRELKLDNIEDCIEEKIQSKREESNRSFWKEFEEMLDDWESISINEKIIEIKGLINFDENVKKDSDKKYKEKSKLGTKTRKGERDSKVLTLIKEGKSQKEVAKEMEVSTRTIRNILKAHEEEKK